LSPMKRGFSPLVTGILFGGAKSLLPSSAPTEPSSLSSPPSFSELSVENPQSPSYVPVPAIISTARLGRVPSRNSPSGECLSTRASAIIPVCERRRALWGMCPREGKTLQSAFQASVHPKWARAAAASEAEMREFACDGGSIGGSGALGRLSAAVGGVFQFSIFDLLSVRRIGVGGWLLWCRSDLPGEVLTRCFVYDWEMSYVRAGIPHFRN
jgi:hypothetical protein